MYTKIIILIGALLIHPSDVEALDTIKQPCNIIRVIDGDTVDSTCGRIRLVRIDSFESRRNNRAYRQAYELNMSIDEVVKRGKLATKVTIKELLNKEITLVTSQVNKDMYGRILGEIYLDQVNINDKLLLEHPDLFNKY